MVLSPIRHVSWRVLSKLSIHTPLSILLILAYSLELTDCRFCFRFDEEMRACAKQQHLPVPSDRQTGYDFGFGSLNETEEMCRTRGHITVFRCMQRALQKKCRNTVEERQLKFIWTFTLDSRRSEKAANYLCKEHNLRIFQRHKEGCLRTLESKAQVCAQTKNATMAEVVKTLRRESVKSFTSSETNLENLKNILSSYECKSIKAKLDCLLNLLRDTCHTDATLLILNYFKETLPAGCVYSQPQPSPHHPNNPSFPRRTQNPQSLPQNHQSRHQIMSDIPHGRYVNDGYYDDSETKSPPKLSASRNTLYVSLSLGLCWILLTS